MQGTSPQALNSYLMKCDHAESTFTRKDKPQTSHTSYLDYNPIEHSTGNKAQRKSIRSASKFAKSPLAPLHAESSPELPKISSRDLSNTQRCLILSDQAA